MKHFKKLIIAALLLPFLFSCSAPLKKETASTLKTDGKAVISGISGENFCGEITGTFVSIYFDFIPAEKDPGSEKISGKGRKLFWDNRETFHKNWVTKWGIKCGNEYRAIRHVYVMKNGSTAVSYEVMLEPR